MRKKSFSRILSLIQSLADSSDLTAESRFISAAFSGRNKNNNGYLNFYNPTAAAGDWVLFENSRFILWIKDADSSTDEYGNPVYETNESRSNGFFSTVIPTKFLEKLYNSLSPLSDKEFGLGYSPLTRIVYFDGFYGYDDDGKPVTVEYPERYSFHFDKDNNLVVEIKEQTEEEKNIESDDDDISI